MQEKSRSSGVTNTLGKSAELLLVLQHITVIRILFRVKRLFASLPLQVGLSTPGLSHEPLTEPLQLRCVQISNVLCVSERAG